MAERRNRCGHRRFEGLLAPGSQMPLGLARCGHRRFEGLLALLPASLSLCHWCGWCRLEGLREFTRKLFNELELAKLWAKNSPALD